MMAKKMKDNDDLGVQVLQYISGSQTLWLYDSFCKESEFADSHVKLYSFPRMSSFHVPSSCYRYQLDMTDP
jgi:hypothetical protein